MACHGTYYFMAEKASKETQKRWGFAGSREKAAIYRQRLIVDRRRRVIDYLRKQYEGERANFKVMFEDWVDIHSPDTPFFKPYMDNDDDSLFEQTDSNTQN